MRFKFFIKARLKTTAFWNFAPCSLVQIVRRFRTATCIYDRSNGESMHLWNVDKLLRHYTTKYLWMLLSAISECLEAVSMFFLCFDAVLTRFGGICSYYLQGVEFWKWKIYVRPKCWYIPRSKHCVTTQSPTSAHILPVWFVPQFWIRCFSKAHTYYSLYTKNTCRR
jgi:hypothetical protein